MTYMTKTKAAVSNVSVGAEKHLAVDYSDMLLNNENILFPLLQAGGLAHH